MKEFQSEAQRHAQSGRYAPQPTASATGATFPSPATAAMAATAPPYANHAAAAVPRGLPAAPGPTGREQNMDTMSSGVRNMSLAESNGYGRPPDTRAANMMDPRRAVDPQSGQLIRSNSFH